MLHFRSNSHPFLFQVFTKIHLFHDSIYKLFCFSQAVRYRRNLYGTYCYEQLYRI